MDVVDALHAALHYGAPCLEDLGHCRIFGHAVSVAPFLIKEFEQRLQADKDLELDHQSAERVRLHLMSEHRVYIARGSRLQDIMETHGMEHHAGPPIGSIPNHNPWSLGYKKNKVDALLEELGYV